MVVIKVELWPYGDESKKRTLATGAIANDGTSDDNRYGNYNFDFSLPDGKHMVGEVKGYSRVKHSIWQLIKMALGAKHEIVEAH